MMIQMMRPRTAILIGALSLAAGWMAGQTTAPSTPAPPAERRSAPRPLGSPAREVGTYTQQLRQKLTAQPRSPMPGRNPFVFGSRGAELSSAAVRRAERPAAAAEAEALPEPAPPALPQFKLSGVASTEKDGAAVLTAILIDNGSMVLAKAGDRLSGGHVVLRVEERAVVIVDADGVTQTVRLP